jgi:hypothetical protein
MDIKTNDKSSEYFNKKIIKEEPKDESKDERNDMIKSVNTQIIKETQQCSLISGKINYII